MMMKEEVASVEKQVMDTAHKVVHEDLVEGMYLLMRRKKVQNIEESLVRQDMQVVLEVGKH